MLHLSVAVESELHVSAVLVHSLSRTHVGALLHSLDICVAVETDVAELPAGNIGGHVVLLHSARAHELLDLPFGLGGTLAFLQSALGFLVSGAVLALFRLCLVRVFDFTMAYHVREVRRKVQKG